MKNAKKYLKTLPSLQKKYHNLEKTQKCPYVVIIAKTPDELEIEGKILDHCVGNMNYSEKFIREETLILFIIKKDDVTTPFVTMEYSLDKKQILQCYGKSDTRPAVEVLDFVNKKWLPYANEQLKLVA